MRIAIAAIALMPLFAKERPSFEVVSIRPGAMKVGQCPDGGIRAVGIVCGGPGTSDPERFTGYSVSLRSLIDGAFGVKPFQLIGGPEWIGTARYEINAVVPPGATSEQFNLMRQTMLADRFHLKTHHETREFSGYNLVLAKGGLRLKENSCAWGGRPDCLKRVEYTKGIAKSPIERGGGVATSAPGSGGVTQTGFGVTLATLAETLQEELKGSVVVDKTGVEGRYDFRFQFSPPDVGIAGEFSGPSLFTALENDLGLKLEPTKTQLDCIVIDHIEPPSEN